MALLPPIGPLCPRWPPGFSSLSIYLLPVISSRFASLYSHHICLALNQHALMFRFGFGSTRTLSFIYSFFFSICHSAADVLLRHCNVSSCLVVCPYVHFFIFFFILHVLYCLSCDTVRVVSHPTLSHTPRIPLPGPPPPTLDPRLPTPSHSLVYHRIPQPHSHLHRTSLFSHPSSLYAPLSTLVPVPVCVLSAHLVYHQSISLLGSVRRFGT
ncbi:hypothetical protein B0J17DRAFT_20518 [Rhizoctonia solani]|nr:hypothetical protein B0J17DRAFT_20518 [Rhizoctonia solani]